MPFPPDRWERMQYRARIRREGRPDAPICPYCSVDEFERAGRHWPEDPCFIPDYGLLPFVSESWPPGYPFADTPHNYVIASRHPAPRRPIRPT